MNHYTNKLGWDAIRSQINWKFKAEQPPGPRPLGAYFTTLPPNIPYLAARLGIPTEKIEYVFCFEDVGDLQPLRGDRGKFIFFSPDDYVVTRESKRQQADGRRAEVECK